MTSFYIWHFISAFIFNFIYGLLSRRKSETIRDKFFRVLWITTLIWKLSEYPIPEQAAQLEHFIAEAKMTNADGTPKSPRTKRKASQSDTDSSKNPKVVKKSKK